MRRKQSIEKGQHMTQPQEKTRANKQQASSPPTSLETEQSSRPQETVIEVSNGAETSQEGQQRRISKAPDWLPSRGGVKEFTVANFLPLGFLVALAIALAWPEPGRVVAIWKIGSVRAIQALNISLVFLVSGLTLRSDDLKKALRNWVGVLYGFFAILILTPSVAFITQQLPFRPKLFAAGLSIFCVVPTSLGVGVAVVAAAKGNEALALFLTLATNILGIVTVPYELKLILRGTSSVEINALDLFVKLVCTVLVPSLVGKAASSASARVRALVESHKVALSLFSIGNLVLIVWQTLSGARDVLLQQSTGHVLVLVCAVMTLHVFYLAVNVVAVRLLRLPLAEAIAVVIMSSQKSAPVAVTVIAYVTPDIATQGLLSIPGVIGQLFQVFLGSFIAKQLVKRASQIGPSQVDGNSAVVPCESQREGQSPEGRTDSLPVSQPPVQS